MKKKDNNLLNLSLTALFIAIIFVSTNFIKIPTSGGFVHLGDCMVLIAAVVLGKRNGIIAAAFGMALVDISAGYLIWAPFTFVIKGIMAYIVASLISKRETPTTLNYGVAFFCAAIFMVIAYFLSGTIIATFISGDAVGLVAGLAYAAKDILGNILQGTAAILIALPLTVPVLKAKNRVIHN